MAFAIGILCEILATMVGTAGKQLISYSARADSKRTRTIFKVSGLFITTLIGPVLDMAAYAFAPQSVIAPLNGLDIVWNTLSAPFTLGERLTTRHVLGSTLVFIGAAATSTFGPHAEAQESLEWVQSVFFSFRFLLYIACMGGLLAFSCMTLLARPKGHGDQVRGIALGATAGAIAGNMFFISAGLGLLRSSASTGDWSAWNNWLPYVILGCGLVVAVSNIPFMTKGLQEYEALFMVTLFEGCHIVVACFSSVWVLGEMRYTALSRCLVYWFCVGLIVLGLLIIRTTSAAVARIPRAPPANLQPGEICRALTSDATDTESELGLQIRFPPHFGANSEEEDINGLARALSRAEAGSAVIWASTFSGIGSIHFVHPEDVPDDDHSEEFTSEDVEAAAGGAVKAMARR